MTMFSTFLFLVPLGSIPELPAESCAEIGASEGEDVVSGNYWFDSILGEVVLARCHMSKLGNYMFRIVPQYSTSGSSNEPTLTAKNYVKMQAVSMIRVSVFLKVNYFYFLSAALALNQKFTSFFMSPKITLH